MLTTFFLAVRITEDDIRRPVLWLVIPHALNWNNHSQWTVKCDENGARLFSRDMFFAFLPLMVCELSYDNLARTHHRSVLRPPTMSTLLECYYMTAP